MSTRLGMNEKRSDEKNISRKEISLQRTMPQAVEIGHPLRVNNLILKI